MWHKFKEQLPAVLCTALLVGLLLGGYVYYLHARVIPEQQRQLTALRLHQAEELRLSTAETHRQLEAVNALLKEAVLQRSPDAFLSPEEATHAEDARNARLAEVIAAKIQPFNPLPQTPEEAERVQAEQIDKVSSGLAERIQPILAQMAGDQNLTRDAINAYSSRISSQITDVLSGELAKNQILNNRLQETQAVTLEAIALSHELSAMYLAAAKDQGVVTRLLLLPANIVRDAAQFNLVNSTDRKEKEDAIVARMNALQDKLNDTLGQTPRS